jgi:hypothetical protein
MCVLQSLMLFLLQICHLHTGSGGAYFLSWSDSSSVFHDGKPSCQSPFTLTKVRPWVLSYSGEQSCLYYRPRCHHYGERMPESVVSGWERKKMQYDSHHESFLSKVA